jgi:serine/threonine-protein kinase
VIAVTHPIEPSPATDSAICCPGCNERFARLAGTSNCPRCGANVPGFSEPELGETLLIRDLADDGQLPGTVRDQQTSLDGLVGTDLHVYRCESLLGAGGMGRVFLARHRDLERFCALKILLPRLVAKDTDYVARFQHEGRATAALVHPNIVTIHAIGEMKGFHFLEMEFIPGRSLQKLLDTEGRLTPTRSAVLCARIAEGLAAAHREKIIHRDLKPDNVLLTHQGIPKISDFGLAKRVAPHADSSSADTICGTPNFMAPELFYGDRATTMSDVYALGVCFYLMLTGRLPHTAGSFRRLQQLVSTEPPPNVRKHCPDIPLEMVECLSLMLAKSPANRPRDAIEATQLLKAVLGELRDVESLLKEAFDGGTGVTWTRSGQKYTLQLALPEGRRQTVFVEPSAHSSSERLLLIYSTCCEAAPAFYEQALRLNAEIPHGGLSIREVDGQMQFVMVDTYPRATVDVEEIRRSILEVAYRADAVENLLTRQDRH